MFTERYKQKVKIPQTTVQKEAFNSMVSSVLLLGLLYMTRCIETQLPRVFTPEQLTQVPTQLRYGVLNPWQTSPPIFPPIHLIIGYYYVFQRTK